MSNRSFYSRNRRLQVAPSIAGLFVVALTASVGLGGGASLAAQPIPNSIVPGTPVPRVGSSVGPSLTPAPDVHVLTLEEFQSELYAANADGHQRTVIADVVLDTTLAVNHESPQCLRAEGCPTVVGEIVGVPGVPVWASPEVAGSLGDPPPAHVNTQPLAFTFSGGDVITLLGLVLSYDATTVVGPASASALEPVTKGPLAYVAAVHGWLSWSGPLPCPLPALPTPPPNSPFQTCPGAWVTQDAYQPVQGNSVVAPADGIRVQPEAYSDFASENAGQLPAPPVEGTWLLRLVEDPRRNADPKRGWQVVERLDSHAAEPAPSPSPVAVITPDDPLLHGQTPDRIGTRLAVRGWVVDDGPPVSCPSVVAPTTPPPDIYEPSCYEGVWITKDEYQPFRGSRFSLDVTPPDSATSVRVQSDAYDAFAPDPHRDENGASVPQLGTYLVELIRDPRFPVDGSLGWQVIARLDPS